MELHLDPEACTGHGRCYSLVPELFDSDDAGRSLLKRTDLPSELVDAARRAAANCPEKAITVVD